jgi:hypothetical protein
MRLIDSVAGHLFELPPENVILLAPPRPKRRRPLPPAPLRLSKARTLTVHSSDGSAAEYEQTAQGWRKRRF